MTMSTQDKVSKKANPDSQIPEGAGLRHKVVNNFTDNAGRHWQTDEDFTGDEAELKLRLRNGQIRADGEPQHYADASGEHPDPNAQAKQAPRR